MGIQAFSHNSEIWYDGSTDFTFLNVRHVGKNMMILSLSSTGSAGGQNHGRATNGTQPIYANHVKPVTAPRASTQAHITFCKKCLEWISRRYPCDCSHMLPARLHLRLLAKPRRDRSLSLWKTTPSPWQTTPSPMSPVPTIRMTLEQLLMEAIRNHNGGRHTTGTQP